MLGIGSIMALKIKQYELENKMNVCGAGIAGANFIARNNIMKKEIKIELRENISGTYEMPHHINLERTDLGHRLEATLIIELPDEKLRLSRSQILKAYRDGCSIETLLSALGFSE